MDFKTYIRNLRNKIGISQEESAKRMGVSISSIQNWERGDNKPDMNSISSIAKVYNVKPSEIIIVLAKEFDGEDNTMVEHNNEDEYKSVLSKSIDYSLIERLQFTEDEQDLFLILALSKECSSEPLPLMLDKAENYLDIALFLDKLKELGVVTEGLSLTDKGAIILNNIKLSKGKIFDVYSLDFKTFIQLCELYGIIKNFDITVKIIKEMMEIGEYYLNDYKKESNYYRGEYYKVIEVESGIRIRKGYSEYMKYRRDILSEYLDSDYFTVVKEEPSDEEYIQEKELYLRKMEFYEAHKDLNEGLIKPAEFQERVYYKAVLTEKAIKLIKVLEG